MRLCPSVGPLVRLSVGLSVGPSVGPLVGPLVRPSRCTFLCVLMSFEHVLCLGKAITSKPKKIKKIADGLILQPLKISFQQSFGF